MVDHIPKSVVSNSHVTTAHKLDTYISMAETIASNSKINLKKRVCNKSLDHVAEFKTLLNNLCYERKRMLKRKIKLETEYEDLLKKTYNNNAQSFTVSRLDALEKKYEEYLEKNTVEEMNKRILSNILEKERKLRLNLSKAIEETKEDLKVTGDLGSEAEKVKLKEVKRAEGVKQNQGFQLKIDQKQKQNELILQEIENSKKRVEEMEQQKLYKMQKEEKILMKIKIYKERREENEKSIRKFSLYKEEYANFIKKYQEMFKINTKQEIRLKKEANEIEEQTSNNQENEKLKSFFTLSNYYRVKNEEKNMLKSKITEDVIKLNKLSMLDKGEYNNDILSHTLVKNVVLIDDIIKNLEEKYEILRSVLSAIKCLLAKLNENDKELELATWYVPAEIADIGDISTAEMRPKISKLLLFLEQKIISFCSTALQKLEHLKKFEDSPDDIDIYYLPNSGLAEFCTIFTQYANLSRSPRRISRKSTLTAMPFKPIVGKAIPRCNDWQNREQRDSNRCSLKEDKRNDVVTNSPYSECKPRRRDDHQNDMEELDMFTLNSNIKNVVSKTKSARVIEKLGNDMTEQEIKQIINQNKEMISCFSNKRCERKLEVLRNQGKSLIGNKNQARKKSGVTTLSLQTENDIAKSPSEIVSMATEVFGPFDKIKSSSIHVGLKNGHKAIPNMVSAILSMKKAKKSEQVEKIAQECKKNFYLDEHMDGRMETEHESKSTIPDNCFSKDISQIIREKLNRLSIENTKELNNFEKRINQLKSLKNIETLPKPRHTSFDFFGFPTCENLSNNASNSSRLPSLANSRKKSLAVILSPESRLGTTAFSAKNSGIEFPSTSIAESYFQTARASMNTLNMGKQRLSTAQVYQQSVRPKKKK